MLAILSAPELLQPTGLRDLLHEPGPCITATLPPYHPGEGGEPWASLLKTKVREAARRLFEASIAPAVTSMLLDPVKGLTKDPAFSAGSHWGRVIFRSPSVFRQFQLTEPANLCLTLAGSFCIRNLLTELQRPPGFYVLCLSKARATLLKCAGFQVELARLSGVPEELAEALALEPPDHDLENRSAAGASSGQMRGVRFGTGSARERQRAHLADFYKLVDREFRDFVRQPEIPLILAGLDEHQTLFRSVADHPGLLPEGIPARPADSNGEEELLKKSYQILAADRVRRETADLAAMREQTPAACQSSDPAAALNAAFEGRVAQLFINENVQIFDLFERAGYRSYGQEDLLNLAIVQTLIHNGKASLLPAEAMHGESLAAILRY